LHHNTTTDQTTSAKYFWENLWLFPKMYWHSAIKKGNAIFADKHRNEMYKGEKKV
jgi:hypothetical protein